MKTPKILIYDIETAPALGWFWRTGKASIGAHQILRPGKIICISYRFTHWKEGRVASLKWKSKKRDNRFSYPFSDEKLVKDFYQVAEKADILIGHNGDSFDRKWVNARLAYYEHETLKHHITEDTLKQSRQQFNLPSQRLDFLCKYFNLPGKISTPTGLWEKVCFDGDTKALDTMVEYCENDVLILDALYDRIKPYVKTKTNLGVFNGISGICPKCGSDDARNKGYVYTAVGKFQSWGCRSCGARYRDGKNLIEHSSDMMRG